MGETELTFVKSGITKRRAYVGVFPPLDANERRELLARGLVESLVQVEDITDRGPACSVIGYDVTRGSKLGPLEEVKAVALQASAKIAEFLREVRVADVIVDSNIVQMHGSRSTPFCPNTAGMNNA